MPLLRKPSIVFDGRVGSGSVNGLDGIPDSDDSHVVALKLADRVRFGRLLADGYFGEIQRKYCCAWHYRLAASEGCEGSDECKREKEEHQSDQEEPQHGGQCHFDEFFHIKLFYNDYSCSRGKRQSFKVTKKNRISVNFITFALFAEV